MSNAFDALLAYYTLAFAAKWPVYNDPPPTTAGWLSTQIKVKTGLDNSGNSQSAKSNLGTITEPPASGRASTASPSRNSLGNGPSATANLSSWAAFSTRPITSM
jgi:hypothetical protein